MTMEQTSGLLSLVASYGYLALFDERRLAWIGRRSRRFGPWASLIAPMTPDMRICTSVLAGLAGVSYSLFPGAL